MNGSFVQKYQHWIRRKHTSCIVAVVAGVVRPVTRWRPMDLKFIIWPVESRIGQGKSFESQRNRLRNEALNDWGLGMVIGAVSGYLYWYFVGCEVGSCAITSSPGNNTLWGSLQGVALTNVIRRHDQ